MTLGGFSISHVYDLRSYRSALNDVLEVINLKIFLCNYCTLRGLWSNKLMVSQLMVQSAEKHHTK